MDTKLLCIVQGIIGVIFGLLALMLPDITLGSFIAFFWILLIAGIILSLILATTSSTQETMFWFSISVLLLAVGVISFFVQGVIAIVFVLIFAGWAFYLGFTDISLALTQPKTKYYLITGMFAVGVLLLAAIVRYLPMLTRNPVLMVLGVFALVFGVFSLLMGWWIREAPVSDPVPKETSCSCQRPGEK
jgi:uncharacterized membrane protein HdeD (DUF308 family)